MTIYALFLSLFIYIYYFKNAFNNINKQLIFYYYYKFDKKIYIYLQTYYLIPFAFIIKEKEITISFILFIFVSCILSYSIYLLHKNMENFEIEQKIDLLEPLNYYEYIIKRKANYLENKENFEELYKNKTFIYSQEYLLFILFIFEIYI